MSYEQGQSEEYQQVDYEETGIDVPAEELGEVANDNNETNTTGFISNILFISRFRYSSTSESDIRKLLETFGKVTNIIRKEKLAFVEFESAEDAAKAKQALHYHPGLGSDSLIVDFKKDSGDNDVSNLNLNIKYHYLIFRIQKRGPLFRPKDSQTNSRRDYDDRRGPRGQSDAPRRYEDRQFDRDDRRPPPRDRDYPPAGYRDSYDRYPPRDVGRGPSYRDGPSAPDRFGPPPGYDRKGYDNNSRDGYEDRKSYSNNKRPYEQSSGYYPPGPPPPQSRGPPRDYDSRDGRDNRDGRGPAPRGPPPRDYPPRDLPPRDLPPRDLPPRDLPPRDMPPRDLPPRDLPPRDLPPRDYDPRGPPPGYARDFDPRGPPPGRPPFDRDGPYPPGPPRGGYKRDDGPPSRHGPPSDYRDDYRNDDNRGDYPPKRPRN